MIATAETRPEAKPETLEMSPTIGALAGALALAQGEIGHAGKDRDVRIRLKAGGEYGYRYATLAAIHDAIRQPLAKNGLAISQLASAHGQHVRVVTLLIHSSGEWIRSSLVMQSDEVDPKRLGAHISFARRYGLSALVCVASVDDDDEAAMEPRPKPPGRIADMVGRK